MTRPAINNIQDIISLPRTNECQAEVARVRLTSGRDGDNQPSPMARQEATRQFVAETIADNLAGPLLPRSSTASGLTHDLMRDLLLGRQLAMLEFAAIIYGPELQQKADPVQLEDKQIRAGKQLANQIWEGRRASGKGRYGAIIKFLADKMADTPNNTQVSPQRLSELHEGCKSTISEAERLAKSGLDHTAAEELSYIKSLINTIVNIQIGQYATLEADALGQRIFEFHTRCNFRKFTSPYLDQATPQSNAYRIIDPMNSQNLQSPQTDPIDIVWQAKKKEIEEELKVNRAQFVSTDQNNYGTLSLASKASLLIVHEYYDKLLSELLYTMMSIDLQQRIDQCNTPDMAGEKAVYEAQLNLLKAIHSLQEVVDAVMEVKGPTTERFIEPKVQRILSAAAVAAAGVLVAGGVFVVTMEAGAAIGGVGIGPGALTHAIFGGGNADHVMQMAANASPLLIFCATVLGLALGIGLVSGVVGHKVYNRPDPAIQAQDFLDKVAKGDVDALVDAKQKFTEFSEKNRGSGQER